MGKRFWLFLVLACILSVSVSFFSFNYMDKAWGTPVEYRGEVIGVVQNCSLFGCTNTIVIMRDEYRIALGDVSDTDYAVIEKGDSIIITARKGKFTGKVYILAVWNQE